MLCMSSKAGSAAVTASKQLQIAAPGMSMLLGSSCGHAQ
jgi:hypothetical protein